MESDYSDDYSDEDLAEIPPPLEINVRTIDDEKDTFELIIPAPIETYDLTAQPVITGSPLRLTCGKLAFQHHRIGVSARKCTHRGSGLFNSSVHYNSVEKWKLEIVLEINGNSTQSQPITNNVDMHLISNDTTKETIRNKLRLNKVQGARNSILYNNLDYWKSEFVCGIHTTDFVLPNKWDANIDRIKFVFNVKDTEEKKGLKRKLDTMDYFLSENLSDVDIVCGGQTLKAHKLMLANKSPVFQAMFQNDMTETREGRVDIEDISPEVMKELLRYCYSGNLDFPSAYIIVGIFRAAHKYQMEELKNECVQQMLDGISLRNVLEIHSLADEYQSELLLKNVMKFLKLNMAKVVETHEEDSRLIQWSLKQINELLKAEDSF